MILLLLGCPPKTTPVTEPEVVAPPVAEEAGAGTVVDGRFSDVRYDFSIGVAEGWSAEVWPDTGALRVRLVHAETGTMMEAWAFEHRIDSPAPRGDCVWSFIDEGHYREVLRPRRVASCTPNNPSEPRILAWMMEQGGMTWQLELHIPVTQLHAGRVAGEAVLSTISL